jgi:hypothetical protein
MEHMQQRIDFPVATEPLRLALSLGGLWVLVEYEHRHHSHALDHLAAIGVSLRLEAQLVSFPVRELSLLTRLPEYVTVVVDHLLHPLWLLASNPSPQRPAYVEVLAGSLRVTWLTDRRRFDEVLHTESVPALLAMETPIVATAEAWSVLSGASSMPVTVARCRVGTAGYIEIDASKPQLVEAAPLPGLFRISDTQFGLPIAYAPYLDSAKGFVWDGPRPPTASKVYDLPSMYLSDSARQTALEIATRLGAYGSALLEAPPGSSRRVAVMTALRTVRATNAVVVCAPWALWAWSRAAAVCGMEVSMYTYKDVAYGEDIGTPDAIVFDDLSVVPIDLQRAASRLDTTQSYRVVVVTSLPESLAEQVALMSRCKPSEFQDDSRILTRYPTAPQQRAYEHMRPYVVRSAPSPGGLSRLSVEVLDIPESLRDACATVTTQGAARVREVSSIVTCGTSGNISPKLALAIQRAAAASKSGRSLVVCCRHERFATLFMSLTRTSGMSLLTAQGVSSSGVLVFDDVLPDLGHIDEVLFVDWPLSMSAIESALPLPKAPEDGPVICVAHVRDSIDDRLALRAVRSPVSTQLTGPELSWVLT